MKTAVFEIQLYGDMVAEKYEDLSVTPFQAIESDLPLRATLIRPGYRRRRTINPRYIVWAEEVAS